MRKNSAAKITSCGKLSAAERKSVVCATVKISNDLYEGSAVQLTKFVPKKYEAIDLCDNSLYHWEDSNAHKAWELDQPGWEISVRFRTTNHLLGEWSLIPLR